jgi:hypothetical protein
MDSFRGSLVDRGSYGDASDAYDDDEDIAHDLPPAAIGTDERRMQVRAYNFWAGLLDNRNFPSVEDLDPSSVSDFGPHSVLLDFTNGIENPAIQYLGEKLAEECGADGPISTLGDVPSRSLLSRITDHYMQILANQAPIGFEAEFVNQREKTILYRGILLPFSSDDDTIDFIYGVINWKELADQRATDELLLEIDQALEAKPLTPRRDAPLTEWADGPADGGSDILDLGIAGEPVSEMAWPQPLFGSDSAALDEIQLELDAPAEDMELADWLASAREMARAAQGSEDRTRQALYAAIGRAYDFSLAAADAPSEFEELVAESGLTIQERAPMTPVVKLVFGADYDKTRLTEYAAALGHAHRVSLARGSLATYLAAVPGGLKGLVAEERRLRRADAGKAESARETPREALARKLRSLPHRPLDNVDPQGGEFMLLVARRLPNGEVVLIGEIGDDVPLLERAAKRLMD